MAQRMQIGADMIYLGHVQGGKVVFDGPSIPAEGSAVRVEVVAAADASPPVPASGFLDHYKDVIGLKLDAPPDGSANIDHYIYGHPKR